MTTAIPSSLTTFVGREGETATLAQMVASRRLVTLVGAGGIGKTRLALHVATRVEAEFPNGIYMLELASLSDPDQVLSFVGSILAIREQAEQSLLQTIINTLRFKHTLLIFDNCEHVIESCATLAHSLLQHCPQLHLLATSREGLRLMGEVLWRVPPLSSPTVSSSTSLDHLLRYDAVQLFYARASTADPSFHPTLENISMVAHICHRLDGLPLALELAAALLSNTSIDQLASYLDERFHTLMNANRVPTRHQTLQATFDWSYELLSSAEQKVLQRLSVFGGSWTLEAAEFISADEQNDGKAIFSILTHLIQASWIVPQENQAGQMARYRLLETIQQYASQRLMIDTDVAYLHKRHWEWYLSFIEAIAHHFYGAEQVQWLQYVEGEIDNLRLALERSLESGQIEVAARIAIALGPFWVRRSRLSEGRFWYDTLLSLSELPTALRLLLLHHAAEVLRFQGEYTRMRALLKERITLLQALDTSADLAATYCALGWAAFYQGDCEEATTYCSEGLFLFRKSGDQAGIARSLSALALVAMLQQEYLRARTLLQEVIAIRRTLQDSAELVFALNALGRVTALQNETQLAYQACEEALQLVSPLKQPFGIIYSLEAVATLAGTCGKLMEAVQLFGAAHALRATIGIPIPPSLRALREHELFPLRSRLDAESFEGSWARGQSLSLDQAYARALETLEQMLVVATPEPPARLSRREIEVLRLVGTGLTDAQVAEELVLSTRTVSTHLRSIYRKVGVPSRSAAIRFAVDHHLL